MEIVKLIIWERNSENWKIILLAEIPMENIDQVFTHVRDWAREMRHVNWKDRKKERKIAKRENNRMIEQQKR